MGTPCTEHIPKQALLLLPLSLLCFVGPRRAWESTNRAQSFTGWRRPPKSSGIPQPGSQAPSHHPQPPGSPSRCPQGFPRWLTGGCPERGCLALQAGAAAGEGRPRAGALPRQAAPTERLEPPSSASRSLSPSPAAGGAADPLGDCPAAWERGSAARCPPGCATATRPRAKPAPGGFGEGRWHGRCLLLVLRALSEQPGNEVLGGFPPVFSSLALGGSFAKSPLPVSGDEPGAPRVQPEPNRALGLSSAREERAGGEHSTGGAEGAEQQRLRA